jgi:S1-C subfamily serine protease
VRTFTLAAILLFLFTIQNLAADWSVIAADARDSIVEIAISSEAGEPAGACTGFVSDNDRDFVVTAAHCDGPKVFADNMPAKVRMKDVKNDLMVLHVDGIDRPALKLAAEDPKIGAEVASFGFGYALERPLFRVAHVSAADIAIERGRYFAVDATFVPGQSGGPVVNEQGQVVMLVQMGTNVVGLGVGTETIKDKVGRFFAL